MRFGEYVFIILGVFRQILAFLYCQHFSDWGWISVYVVRGNGNFEVRN
jgi:hypothetical protein